MFSSIRYSIAIYYVFLNFFQSLKKSLFKPAAFFKGILIPLCEVNNLLVLYSYISIFIFQKSLKSIWFFSCDSDIILIWQLSLCMIIDWIEALKLSLFPITKFIIYIVRRKKEYEPLVDLIDLLDEIYLLCLRSISWIHYLYIYLYFYLYIYI